MFNGISFVLFGIMVGGFIFLSYKSMELTTVFPKNKSLKPALVPEQKKIVNVFPFFS